MARLTDETGHRVVAQTNVEDGLHHAGHGDHGTRPHRQQQGVAHIAQALAHEGLQRGQAVLQQIGHGLLGVGGMGCAQHQRLGHVQAELTHAGQVVSLVAQLTGIGMGRDRTSGVANQMQMGGPTRQARRRRGMGR